MFNVVVQSSVLPFITLTVLPFSAVPLNSGVLSLTVLLATGALIVGIAGGVLSMLKLVLGVAALVPPLLPATALMLCAPLAKGVAGVQLQVPLPSTVVVQTGAVPSVTVIVAPAVPVPPITG